MSFCVMSASFFFVGQKKKRSDNGQKMSRKKHSCKVVEKKGEKQIK